MRRTYNEIRNLVKSLYDLGSSFSEIRSKTGYTGSDERILKLVNSNPKMSTRDYATLHERSTRTKKRMKVLNYFGCKCNRCGFSDPRALQVDHVNGGGLREVKAIGVYYLNKKLMERIDAGEEIKDYQLLCANCNWIKRHENNENSTGKKL